MAKPTRKRRVKKNIESGIAHIHATFNNTIVMITDVHGNAIAWSSAGALGFKNSRLQRINFLQDIGIDAAKDRVYLPAATLAAAGSSAETLLAEARAGRLGAASRQAVRLEWQSTQAQLLAGVALPQQLPWRLAAELRFIIAGGQRILDRIAHADYDSVARRPALGWRDGPALLRLALFPRRQA